MYGVPEKQERAAQALADDILNGLRGAQTAVEGRSALNLSCMFQMLARLGQQDVIGVTTLW